MKSTFYNVLFNMICVRYQSRLEFPPSPDPLSHAFGRRRRPPRFQRERRRMFLLRACLCELGLGPPHRQKSGEDVQRWASPARFCSAAAGTREGAYYLVAPSLHEGVMKTEREGRRGWASRRGKEGSFYKSKYAKMASKTPNFDLRNGIYIYLCIISSLLFLNLTHFITHFFDSKIAHPSRTS